jgi:hypothetical protein
LASDTNGLTMPGGDGRVVVGGEVVADVVDERAQHVLVVATVALGAGGGLQRVLEPVHREPAVVAARTAASLMAELYRPVSQRVRSSPPGASQL